MSQFFHIGPSFYFMKSRFNHEKMLKMLKMVTEISLFL